MPPVEFEPTIAAGERPQNYVLILCHSATSRKVAISIPDGVTEIFLLTSFRPHYVPGIDSASNRNKYQEYFLGVKAAGA
jgi:hypothetical protein